MNLEFSLIDKLNEFKNRKEVPLEYIDELFQSIFYNGVGLTTEELNYDVITHKGIKYYMISLNFKFGNVINFPNNSKEIDLILNRSESTWIYKVQIIESDFWVGIGIFIDELQLLKASIENFKIKINKFNEKWNISHSMKLNK